MKSPTELGMECAKDALLMWELGQVEEGLRLWQRALQLRGNRTLQASKQRKSS